MRSAVIGGISLLGMVTGIVGLSTWSSSTYRARLSADALLAMTNSLPANTAAGTSTDPAFFDAVTTGLKSLNTSSSTAAMRAQILNGEHQTAWDEFGTNVVVDGGATGAAVDAAITSDIIQTIDTAQSYNQAEADYLTSQRMTPEDMQSIETDTGTDITPENAIDPDPSAHLNPHVDISSSDIDGSDASSSIQDETAVAPDAPGAADDSDNSRSAIAQTDTATSTSTTSPDSESSATSTPNDDVIFNAILQGDQAAQASSTTTNIAPTESEPESAATPDVTP